jgi:hypothetical protein
MAEYVAPLKDMNFVLTEIAKINEINQLPGFEEATPDLVEAVLEEAAKFATDVLSPLNTVGDSVGAKHEGDTVTTAPGWKEAYHMFSDGSGRNVERLKYGVRRWCNAHYRCGPCD